MHKQSIKSLQQPARANMRAGYEIIIANGKHDVKADLAIFVLCTKARFSFDLT